MTKTELMRIIRSQIADHANMCDYFVAQPKGRGNLPKTKAEAMKDAFQSGALSVVNIIEAKGLVTDDSLPPAGHQIAISDARKSKQDNNTWWVMHPANDAILAYCASEAEADAVIEALNAIRVGK